MKRGSRNCRDGSTRFTEKHSGEGPRRSSCSRAGTRPAKGGRSAELTAAIDARRVPGHPDRRADRRGAGPALPVALLAASAARRGPPDYLRPQLVRTVPRGARRGIRVRTRVDAGLCRDQSNSSLQLVAHGIVVIKFWMHITADEQLRRFREREKAPYKRWKLTDEDWRNRKHWEAYPAGRQ